MYHLGIWCFCGILGYQEDVDALTSEAVRLTTNSRLSRFYLPATLYCSVLVPSHYYTDDIHHSDHC